jgi:DNA-binding CsgD family transcriptional regulator
VTRCVASAADEAEALSLLHEATERMGADAGAFVSFIRDDLSHESYRFLLACDPRWCQEYERTAWYASDPWLTYALTHTEPAVGSAIPIASRQQQAAVDLAAQYGFRSSAVVPAPSSGGLSRIGVLCLGSATDGFFEDAGFDSLKLVARALSMELHEWWIGRIRSELMASTRLSQEDLMMLRRERLGQTSKHIALDLDISISAVDSRFQRITARLGVPTRRAAAHLAAEYGLI